MIVLCMYYVQFNSRKQPEKKLTLDVQRKIGVEFTEFVLDVALVKAGIVWSWIVQAQFNVVDVLLLLDDVDGDLRRLLYHLAGVGPHDLRLRVRLDLAIHNNELALVLRLYPRLLHERRSVSLRFRFRFDIQIQIGVTLAVLVLYVTPVRPAVRCRRILSLPKNNLE